MFDLYCNTDRFWHEISRANELCSQRSSSKVRDYLFLLGLPDGEKEKKNKRKKEAAHDGDLSYGGGFEKKTRMMAENK